MFFRQLCSRHRLESGRITQAGERLACINRHQRRYWRVYFIEEKRAPKNRRGVSGFGGNELNYFQSLTISDTGETTLAGVWCKNFFLRSGSECNSNARYSCVSSASLLRSVVSESSIDKIKTFVRCQKLKKLGFLGKEAIWNIRRKTGGFLKA